MKFKVGDKVRFNNLHRIECPNNYDRKVRKVINVIRDRDRNIAELKNNYWWSWKYLKKVI